MVPPAKRAAVVITVLLLSLGMVLPAQAAAARMTTLSVSTSAGVVNRASLVRISGQLSARNPSAVLPGRQVSLYARANVTGAKWSTVGSSRTNSRGVYAFGVRPNENTVYKVAFRASGGMSSSSSSYLQAVRAPLNGSSVTPGGIVAAGSTLNWRASTTSRLAGKAVSVQLRTTRGWVGVNNGHVAKNGAIAVRFAANARGRSTYRLYLPGSSRYAAGATTQNINVYGWYSLADITTSRTGPFYISSRYYPKSIKSRAVPGWFSQSIDTSFDLGRKCIRLRTTVGLSDTSSESYRADFSYSLDAAPHSIANGVGLRQAFPIYVNVASISRLRLLGTETSNTNGDLLYGDPQVLCSGAPTGASN